MDKYVIISKSRLDNMLDKVVDIANESSASKKCVGKIIEYRNRIDNASFVREIDDKEFMKALNKYGRGKK